MSELNVFNDPSLSPSPLPARYLQLPTVIVNWLQSYFAQSQVRWLPPVSDLVYYGEDALNSQDQLEHGIEIFRLEEYRGDRHTTHRKLLVKRNSIVAQSPGMTDSTRQVGRRTDDLDLSATRYVGKIIIFAASKAPGEAEFLAAESEQLFSHYRRIIRQKLMLSKFEVSQVGDIGKIRELPEFFVVPVSLDYIYEDNVAVSSNKFPIRNIKLDIK